jgi:hypothetical protein
MLNINVKFDGIMCGGSLEEHKTLLFEKLDHYYDTLNEFIIAKKDMLE